MEELSQVELPYPDRDAKNLFVRDDKRRNYYLITVRGDKRVNLKDFRRRQGTKPLTFASPEELQEVQSRLWQAFAAKVNECKKKGSNLISPP